MRACPFFWIYVHGAAIILVVSTNLPCVCVRVCACVCTCVCARVEMEGKAWYVVSARSLLVLCSFSATVLLVLCDRHGMYYIGRAEVSFPVRVSARCCGAAYCVCALVRARVTTSSTFTCISQYVLETW